MRDMEIEQPDRRPLLKPAELAARLGVSRAWLYEAAKTGRIPAIRIGGPEGPLRFVAEDVERWIDQARAAWTPGRRAASTLTQVSGDREVASVADRRLSDRAVRLAHTDCG